MKFFIVFLALFAVALAAPPHGHHDDHHHAEILRYDSDVHPDGFKFGFETSDHVQHDAEGHLKKIDKDHDAIVVHGHFSWVDKDGHKYFVKYVADENGYKPEVSPGHA